MLCLVRRAYDWPTSALDAHRLFLSTVTSELGRFRTELAARFERVSVKAVHQDEFEHADTDLVENLYEVIEPYDVVIHFDDAGAFGRPIREPSWTG